MLLPAAAGAQGNAQRYIRVKVFDGASHLSLKIAGGYQILDASGQKVLSEGENLAVKVSSHKNGIFVDKRLAAGESIFVQNGPQGSIEINGRRYRGNVRIIKRASLCLEAINYIELEEYVKGILFHEVSHYWPKEALKAQAIACRTFALFHMGENKLKDFDLSSDVYSQVYGGRGSERYRTNEAVEQTKDMVLVFTGKVFPAYYHSTCSGQTEDASRLWKINIAPLKGVSCSYCRDSKHFSWRYRVPLKKMRSLLEQAGLDTGDILDISVLGRNASARVTQVGLKGEKKSAKLTAKELRSIIGPEHIRSTNFTVSIQNGALDFNGFGWGHGVGMCQWGAYFMAKHGRSYEEILHFYYPRAEISKL